MDDIYLWRFYEDYYFVTILEILDQPYQNKAKD